MIKKIRAFSEILSIMAVLAAAAWYIYAPAQDAPFVFDDVAQILENPFIRFSQPSPQLVDNLLKCPNTNRVLSYASFGLNYYFHGYNVTGYHVVNVAIHVLTACLVFLVARLTLGLPGIRSSWAPFLAAALWLVNPVHTQSTTYIVQRMNALSALFVLLALACYILARRLQIHGKTGLIPTFLLIGTGFSGLCGLASKETAAILPVIILLYEWFFFQNLDRTWLKKQTVWISIAIISVTIIAFVYMDGNPVEKLAGMYKKRGFTPAQRLLTEPQIVLYYLTLLTFPHPARLNLDYNFPLALSPANPATTLPAILALMALTVIALYAAKKHRLVSFAILWFLVTLAIESSFIGLALIFEHRTYLPSVFPAIAVIHLLTHRIKHPLVAVLTAVTLITACGYGAWQRNRVWATPLVFWQDCNAKSPDKPRILNNLGMAYKGINKIEAASQAFQSAIDRDPEQINALNNLGMILLEKSKTGEALVLFEKALNIEPDFYDAHYNRGLALLASGNVLAATQAFQETIRLNPFSDKAHNNLGAALLKQIKPDQAIIHFQRALTLNPAFIETYSNMGLAYLKKGMADKAMDWFNQALDIDPFYIDAYDNLRRVRSKMKKHGDAITRLEKSVIRDPDNPPLIYSLAEAYKNAGMHCIALEYYEKALSLQPDAIDYLNRLGSLYTRYFQYQRAAVLFERLSVLMPEIPVIHYNLACIYALQDQKEKALRQLEAAIKYGYDNRNQIAADKDLENIRDTEYFKKIINIKQEKEGG